MHGSPQHFTFDASEAAVSYYVWGEAGAKTILLIHATGFHARVWDRTVAALPEGYRVIAVDLRGHGRSGKPGPIHDWRTPARDVGELVDHLGLQDAIGVGHSMGGHCLTQVASARPGAFERLVLIDPVMLEPAAYECGVRQPVDPQAHPVARRRNEWRDWQEMFARFEDRHPYSLWRREVLEDYCRYGVLPAPEGEGYVLACPPEIEASVYLTHASVDIYAEAAKVQAPVTVVRAKPVPRPAEGEMPDFAGSPTWEGVAGGFPKGRDVYLPEMTHFIPMQDPELTARYILDEVRAA